MTAFTVRQGQFEGPLELLLALIEKRKLHINDVALAAVADDFLSYARSRADFPLAESAQFAFIAATLLLIKSRSLLPALALTEEEEASVEELERRLKLLRRFRELSYGIAARFGKRILFSPRERIAEPTFASGKTLSLSALREALGVLIASLPKPETLQKTAVQKVISLEEMIKNLAARVQSALSLSFREFTQHLNTPGGYGAGFTRANKTEKTAIIVSFLALLELVRQGIIAARQERRGEDIVMETGSADTPRR